MRKKNKAKKKIKILIMICVIILIILLVMLSILKKNEKNNTIENNATEITVIRGLENKHPNGTFYLSKEYTGKFEMNEISTKVSKFMTSSIPTLRKIIENKNEEQIKKYYNDNYDTVKELCGSISEEDFIKLTNVIMTLESEALNYTTSEYLIDTITDNGNIFKVNLEINYENEEPITVTIKINEEYRQISLITR